MPAGNLVSRFSRLFQLCRDAAQIPGWRSHVKSCEAARAPNGENIADQLQKVQSHEVNFFCHAEALVQLQGSKCSCIRLF